MFSELFFFFFFPRYSEAEQREVGTTVLCSAPSGWPLEDQQDLTDTRLIERDVHRTSNTVTWLIWLALCFHSDERDTVEEL